jgi:hypothetical protein
MSEDSEFLHMVAKADALSVQIQDVLRGMSGSGAPTILHALCSDIVQVMPRFSMVWSRWVSRIVQHGLRSQGSPGLRDLHCQMRSLAHV